jgi:N-acetyl-anhydromuramyl-L-alanine amidase AmpD
MADAWMPDVLHEPTAAFGYSYLPRGSTNPVAVMSHIMQGYQRTMRQWAAERPPVAAKSAHFTIGRDGLIVQHVGLFDASWTAGRVALPTWRLLPPGGNPNMLAVHIEHEGFSTDPGYGYDYLYSASRPWPAEMVRASIRVHRWVFAELGIKPSLDTVIGHFMTDGKDRINDPGAAWPREHIIAELRGYAPAPEPSLSRAIDQHEAYLLVADAFNPAFSRDKTTWRSLPMEGGRRRYLVEVDDR